MIYVASSWKNELQPIIVAKLKAEGLDVYDFRADGGFNWAEIDKNWEKWSTEKFVEILDHPLATSNFIKDVTALKFSDTVILINPCGKSAHLELGYAVGKAKNTAVLLTTGEPELMYKMVDEIFTDVDKLIAWVKSVEKT